MKILRLLAVVLLAALVLAMPVYAVVTIYFDRTDYTGGTSGCLDELLVGDLVDGDLAFVQLSGVNFDLTTWHRYDASSAANALNIKVIAPADATGDGRWILISAPIVAQSIEPTGLPEGVIWIDTSAP